MKLIYHPSSKIVKRQMKYIVQSATEIRYSSAFLINLSHYTIEDIRWIQSVCTNLHTLKLHIHGKDSDEVLRSISRIRSLKKLQLPGLTDPSFLQYFRDLLKLRHLEISGINLKYENVIEITKNMPNLECLSIRFHHSDAHDSLKKIQTLADLKHLKYLQLTYQYCDSVHVLLTIFKCLVQLQQLKLRDFELYSHLYADTFHEVKNLKNLVSLDLKLCVIDSNILAKISENIPHLQSISFSVYRMTSSQLKIFLQTIPQIKKISLTQWRVTDCDIQAIGQSIQDLIELNLSSYILEQQEVNLIHNYCFPDLKQYSNLKVLNLAFCPQLSNQCLLLIATQFRKLEQFSLSTSTIWTLHSNLSDRGCIYLKKLKYLRVLNIYSILSTNTFNQILINTKDLMVMKLSPRRKMQKIDFRNIPNVTKSWIKM